jgi:hypothetical protein
MARFETVTAMVCIPTPLNLYPTLTRQRHLLPSACIFTAHARDISAIAAADTQGSRMAGIATGKSGMARGGKRPSRVCIMRMSPGTQVGYSAGGSKVPTTRAACGAKIRGNA